MYEKILYRREPEMLVETLLGLGTAAVLGRERDAWLVVKRPRQTKSGHTPPPPRALFYPPVMSYLSRNRCVGYVRMAKAGNE